ncbi:4'-phosphopantetheinyl transferase superfamily protein [Massilia cavernae]|uniref:4'-phosphopantetheinyl transferase superfamily protein n=1 Tax=Massilia cavernae TaxID=2320864 RepID=A0A418XAX3_9BURK|nr:polyketide synthase dehydratase domain-containing protein [Massilia cavernae]RJG09587.1 4'-phosphopantetheinyl transferase superfamily protein [Massilia cavernae]
MMAHANKLLAPGAQPLVGRMYEAEAASEPAPAARAPAAAIPMIAPRPSVAPVLPFVGEVTACQRGASISIVRRLAHDADLFLADHNFVHAPGVKPLADCFPVVPMTVSLEIMAEAAACLAPGYGLVGFEDVTARRWIAVAGSAQLALRIEARLDGLDLQQGEARIAVQVFAGDENDASIGATVLFGSHYADPPAPGPAPMAGGAVHDASGLYAARHLFHGPCFQTLAGQVRVGPQGAGAHLLVKPAHGMFAAQPDPQLLADPALLDAVGQLMALWSMEQGQAAFPVGLARMDLYCATPAPGTLVPIRMDITGQQLTVASGDVEIGDGAGGVWMRISGWKSWRFKWARQLVDFQRQPARYLLSDAQALPGASGGLVCQHLTAQRVAMFDLALLARHYLHGSEMPAFDAKKSAPARQREWLLGRVAAKDAARCWSGTQMHPAAFGIEYDGAGQPRVASWPAGLAAPCISIAHCGEHAIAVASAGPAGIDIEKIAARDEHCVASFTSPLERALLAGMEGGARDAWITRLWCAKEALGKRLGTGVDHAPSRFEARSLAPDCSLRMRHHPSNAECRIVTTQLGDCIIALDAGAAS